MEKRKADSLVQELAAMQQDMGSGMGCHGASLLHLRAPAKKVNTTVFSICGCLGS